MTEFKAHYIKFIRDTMGLELDGDTQFQVDKRVKDIESLLAENSVTNFNLYELDDRLKEEIVSLSSNNETAFFRDKLLFKFFKSYVQSNLKSIIPLSVLSMPCSTGQEPYSIAMELDALDLQSHQYDIHCYDIDEEALIRAESGVYTKFEMMRGLTDEKKGKYFTVKENKYTIMNSLKKSLHFKKNNLLCPDITTEFDIIFLRNVLFYFEESKRKEVLITISKHLKKGGVLFLGAGEHVSCVGLEECDFEGLFYLKKI